MKAVDQFTKEGEYVRTWASAAMAANELNLCQSNIARYLDRQILVGGFSWKESFFQKEKHRYDPKVLYSEQQRQEFNSRIPHYMPILYKMLNKYDFINEFNRDDFIQEALVYAWLNYYSYPALNDEHEAARFGAFFKMSCKWGVARYYHYLKSWKAREYEERLHDKAEEVDDSDAKTVALYHCIESLSDMDKRVLSSYMAGKECNEAADDLSITKQDYYHSCQRIKNILKDKINYYLTGIKDIRKRMPGCSGQNPTPIEQFDMMGKFISWYPTLAAAKEKGFSPNAISQVITKRNKTHKGFMWKTSRYTDPNEAKAARRHLEKQVA